MPSYDDWYPQHSDKRNRWEGRVRTWNNTPNFGTVPRDSRPINGYSDQHLRAEQVYGSQYWYQKTGPGTRVLLNSWVDYQYSLDDLHAFFYGRKTATDTLWGANLVGIEDRVQLGAIVKVADAKVNIGVALAEAHKTSDLIYGTARRIDRAYRNLRKGNLIGVAKELNITPSRVHKNWLEYKYGWLPLLMDVKGAAEFFAQQYLTRPPRFTVKARERVTKTFDTSYSYTPWGGIPPTQTISEFSSRSYVYQAAITGELTCPHFAELQQLGVTNPALEQWELVPFSFVFDWFISVGDWLTGLTAFNGVRLIRAWHSSIYTDGWTWSMPPSFREDSTYQYDYRVGPSFARTERLYNRGPWVPSMADILPPVTKRDFGFDKLVTSLALLKGGHRGTVRV